MDVLVTLKLTTGELDALRFALDETLRTNAEAIEAMSTHDGRALRGMQVRLKVLREKL